MQKNDVRGMKKMKMRNRIRKYFANVLHEVSSESGTVPIVQLTENPHLRERRDLMKKNLLKNCALEALCISVGLFWVLASVSYATVDQDFDAVVGAMASKIERVGPIFSSGYSSKTERMEELLRKKMILAKEISNYKREAQDLYKRAESELSRHKAGFVHVDQPVDVLNPLDTFDHKMMRYGKGVEEYELGRIRWSRSEDRHEAQRIFHEHLKSQMIIDGNLKGKQSQVRSIDAEVEKMSADLTPGEKEAVIRSLVGDYGEKIGLSEELIGRYKKRSDAEAAAIVGARHADEHCDSGYKSPATPAVLAGAEDAAAVGLQALFESVGDEDKKFLARLLENQCRIADPSMPSQIIKCLMDRLRGRQPSGDGGAERPLVAKRGRTHAGGEDDDDIVLAQEDEDEEEFRDEDGNLSVSGLRVGRRPARGTAPLPPPPPLSGISFPRDGSAVIGSSAKSKLQEYAAVIFRDDQGKSHFLNAQKLSGDNPGFIFTHNDGSKRDPYFVSDNGKIVMKLQPKGSESLLDDSDAALGAVKSVAGSIDTHAKFEELFRPKGKSKDKRKVSDWIVGDGKLYYRVERLDDGKFKLLTFTTDNATVVPEGTVDFSKYQAKSPKDLVKKLKERDSDLRTAQSSSDPRKVVALQEKTLREKVKGRQLALNQVDLKLREAEDKYRDILERARDPDADRELAKGATSDAKRQYAEAQKRHAGERARINREHSAEIEELALDLKRKKAEILSPSSGSTSSSSPSSSPSKLQRITAQQNFSRLAALRRSNPNLFQSEFTNAFDAFKKFDEFQVSHLKLEKRDIDTIGKWERKLEASRTEIQEDIAKLSGFSLDDSDLGSNPMNKQLQEFAKTLPKGEQKKKVVQILIKLKELDTERENYARLRASIDAKNGDRVQKLRLLGVARDSSVAELVGSLNEQNKVTLSGGAPMSSSASSAPVVVLSPDLHILLPPSVSSSSSSSTPALPEQAVLTKKVGNEVLFGETQVLVKDSKGHTIHPPVVASSGSSSVPPATSYQKDHWYQLGDDEYFYVESVDSSTGATGFKYKVAPPSRSVSPAAQ